MSENVFINSQEPDRSPITADGQSSRRRSEWRRSLAQGGPVRRLESLPEGRQAYLLLQLTGTGTIQGLVLRSAGRGQSYHPLELSTTRAAESAKGGTATLLANDKTVASGKIERTQAMVLLG
jgi:hypothetical protein